MKQVSEKPNMSVQEVESIINYIVKITMPIVEKVIWFSEEISILRIIKYY